MTHHASTPPNPTDKTIMLGNAACFKSKMRNAFGKSADFFNSYF